MKPRNRLPLMIMNEHELRRLWTEFKTYMQTVEAGYTNTQNIANRLTGAALFVDFLCGIKPTRRHSGNSYGDYPDKPWPTD